GPLRSGWPPWDRIPILSRHRPDSNPVPRWPTASQRLMTRAMSSSCEDTMKKRWLIALVCLAVVATAAWLGTALSGPKNAADAWTEVVPGILRTPRLPAGYALVDGDTALLIDVPHPIDDLKAHGVKKVEAVLLTHHHRDTCAEAGSFLVAGVP